MKKNIKFISLSSLFKDLSSSNTLVSLGNSIELPVLLKRIGYRITLASMPSLRKFSSRLKFLYNFGTFLLRMNKNHGPTLTVKYLKASQLALQKYVAGTPFNSLREIEPDLPLRRLSSGLPRVIPLYDRIAIRNGSASVIRYWNTLFSLYKVLDAPGKVKLETITNEFKGDQQKMENVTQLVSRLANQFRNRFPTSVGRDPRLLFLETSSATFKTS